MFDVLVCGAGPAGATVSALLSNGGMKVAVVDPLVRTTERLELIAPSTARLFDAVGLGVLLRDPDLVSFCSGIQRDWGGKVSVEEFISHRGGAGYVVDRRRLDAVVRGLSQKAGARLIRGRVIAIEREESMFRVHVRRDGQNITVTARTMLDASGRAAALARRMGAQRTVHEVLLAHGTQSLANDTRGRLLVEGNSAGWSYRLTGPDGRCEGWHVGTKDGGRGSRCQVVDASSVLCFPPAGPGWAAIGDAAASFDPLCSQGIANALSTALTVAGAVVSNNGMGEPAARAYSEAVRRTFENAERGRRASYAALSDSRS
ncbi:NAD(P)/FAD-dependent oxidoreductase [Bradyrhizobium sp. USDA 3650]